jgi:peptide/nickel transport system ATP-binding protein
MAELTNKALLDVRGLTTTFDTPSGRLLAADGITFSVGAGETLALVGESGCGKSMAGLALLGLVPPPGRITAGEVLFNGEDLTKAAPDRLRDLRGDRIAMIFQEPMTALNPVYTVGEQIAEVLRYHRDMAPAEAWAKAVEALRGVGLPDAELRASYYPHQLSGGQRQRVMIAMSLILEPALVVADEPTTALDVTVAGQVLDLLQTLCREKGTALILITHDLGLVAEYADRVCVLYAGQVVETGPVDAIFKNPRHPYTLGLMAPMRFHVEEAASDARLPTIPGRVPDLRRLPKGCRFQDRCPFVVDACRAAVPDLLERAGAAGHWARCVHDPLPAAAFVQKPAGDETLLPEERPE